MHSIRAVINGGDSTMTIKRGIILSLCLSLLIIRDADAETAYKVQHGDTLWKIAHKFGLSLRSLINSNPQVHDPDLIFPGQEINIPAGKDKRNDNVMEDQDNQLLELTNNKRKQLGLKPLV